jgi:hypothetical protein
MTPVTCTAPKVCLLNAELSTAKQELSSVSTASNPTLNARFVGPSTAVGYIIRHYVAIEL